MYFAGIIADSKAMNKLDFDRWMDVFLNAVCKCDASNFIRVEIAQDVQINGLIASGNVLRMSEG